MGHSKCVCLFFPIDKGHSRCLDEVTFHNGVADQVVMIFKTHNNKLSSCVKFVEIGNRTPFFF